MSFAFFLLGTVYEFRVAAVNEESQGAYSRPSESVTIKDPYDVPTQPGPLDINELTDTSCVLCHGNYQFVIMVVQLLNILLEQRFKTDSSFIRVETTVPVTECYHKIDDLLTNGEYEFRVAARNQADLSAYSQTDRPVVIRAPRQRIARHIEKFPNQTVTSW